MLITLFRHLRAVYQRFPNLLGVFGQCIDPVILMYPSFRTCLKHYQSLDSDRLL